MASIRPSVRTMQVPNATTAPTVLVKTALGLRCKMEMLTETALKVEALSFETRLYLLATYWIGANHISSSRALEQRKALVRAVL